MEHKAPTNLLQPSLSWASQLISFHVLPSVAISSSNVLCQVPSGLPLCLFPGGAHRSALWGCLLLFILRTRLNQLQRLCLTSSTMWLMFVRLLTSVFGTRCSHWSFKIRRKQRPSKPFSLLAYLAGRYVSKSDIWGLFDDFSDIENLVSFKIAILVVKFKV